MRRGESGFDHDTSPVMAREPGRQEDGTGRPLHSDDAPRNERRSRKMQDAGNRRCTTPQRLDAPQSGITRCSAEKIGGEICNDVRARLYETTMKL